MVCALCLSKMKVLFSWIWLLKSRYLAKQLFLQYFWDILDNAYQSFYSLLLLYVGVFKKYKKFLFWNWFARSWVKIIFKNINILFKVARVVNLELAFTVWCFDNLVLLIKLCKIRYLNLDKLFPRNQVICLKNWKRAPTTIKFNIFCWNFAHVSYLTMSTKECSWFFLFCLDLELLIKL